MHPTLTLFQDCSPLNKTSGPSMHVLPQFENIALTTQNNDTFLKTCLKQNQWNEKENTTCGEIFFNIYYVKSRSYRRRKKRNTLITDNNNNKYYYFIS